MAAVQLDPKSTALVLIDLQNGIMGRTLAPHAAGDVVTRAAKLADAVRSKGGTVVYVRVDVSDTLHLPVDAPVRDRMHHHHRRRPLNWWRTAATRRATC